MTNQKIVTRLEFAEHIYHNIQPGETYSFYQKNEDDHIFPEESDIEKSDH